MKKTIPGMLLSAFFAAIFMISCSKTNSHINNAVITGYDARACACCGGLQINFNNEPHSYIGDFYLIDTTLTGLGISETTPFPIYVRVEWEPDTTKCNNYYIKILSITP